jgi:type VI secretion system protein ImpH
LDPEARNETADLSDLIEGLLKNPKEYSYFQAIRLLSRAAPAENLGLKSFLRQRTRIRAEVDLGFPGSDMTEVKKLAPKGERDLLVYRLTVTFLGLYGSASPLPPFYAREILEDVLDDRQGVRGFMDLISYFSYRNHAQTYFRSSVPARLFELNDEFTRDILRSLLGIPHQSMGRILGRRVMDLPYLQLFATKLRHVPGLITYLTGRLDGQEVKLEECVHRTLPIPKEQRARLGHTSACLGETALLGHEAPDLTGKFRIIVEVKSLNELETFMPGGENREILEESVSRYVDSPLVHDVTLSLQPGAVEGFSLGRGARPLGVSSFLRPVEGQPKKIVSPSLSRTPGPAHGAGPGWSQAVAGGTFTPSAGATFLPSPGGTYLPTPGGPA